MLETISILKGDQFNADGNLYMLVQIISEDKLFAYQGTGRDY